MKKWRISGKLMLVITILAFMLISTNAYALNYNQPQGEVVIPQGKASCTASNPINEGYQGGRVGFNVHKPDHKHFWWLWHSDNCDRESVEKVVRGFLYEVLHSDKLEF